MLNRSFYSQSHQVEHIEYLDKMEFKCIPRRCYSLDAEGLEAGQ